MWSSVEVSDTMKESYWLEQRIQLGNIKTVTCYVGFRYLNIVLCDCYAFNCNV